MTLHQSPDFKDAIEAAAQHFKLRPVFIEKDYWVTYVLKNLSRSEYKRQVIFKGGTSLSKAYNCIKRFSEDVDLAILSPGNYNGSQLRALLKKVGNEISKGLKIIDGHPAENKLGKIRTTVYEYPKVLAEKNFGVISDSIQIEINCFANPLPFHSRSIQCYISEYLSNKGLGALISEYQLEPFEISVLSLERTYFEKVLALNRLSYESVEVLEKKVRHFYDLHQLHYHPDLKGKILTGPSYKLVANVLSDDTAYQTIDGDWLGKELACSPLFTNLEEIWSVVSVSYEKGLADLIYDTERPDSDSILEVLKEIKGFLMEFDKLNPPNA